MAEKIMLVDDETKKLRMPGAGHGNSHSDCGYSLNELTPAQADALSEDSRLSYVIKKDSHIFLTV